MDFALFDWLVEAALEEDGARDDVTTGALVDENLRAEARMTARREGVLCGLPAAERVLVVLGADVELEPLADEGADVAAGEHVAVLRGSAADMLRAERTMLNFVQRLSGVATLTRAFCRLVEGTEAAILDTRKTTPGWRALEKYAVRCGGGVNHRMGLNDQVLIKDNHLRLRARAAGEEAGTVRAAVRAAQRNAPGLVVEVEVTDLAQLREAWLARADIIMLDNMTPEETREAVALLRSLCSGGPRPQVESSGGVDASTVRAYAEAGVNRISIGALTHSAPALDIAMDLL